MFGGFYRRDELGPSFFFWFATNCAISIAIVTAIYFSLARHKVDYDKLANVTFIDSRDVNLAKVQPVSQIVEIAQTAGGNNGVVLVGYLENIDSICKNAAEGDAAEEKIIVVAGPNGSKSVGKARIGSKACDILKEASTGAQVFVASDTAPLPVSRKQYLAVAGKDMPEIASPR